MLFWFCCHSEKNSINLSFGTEIQCFKLLKVPSLLTWMLLGGNAIMLHYTDVLQSISTH